MLSRKKENPTVYLEVKFYSLWRSLSTFVDGCDVESPMNPKTKEVTTKYGYKFDGVTGYATKLEWYDTEKKFSERYIGFKLTLESEEGEAVVLDMPYKSLMFKRFASAAPNIDWSKPFKISVFKARNKERQADETAIWIQQPEGQTVKSYYTKDNLNGMPEAEFDDFTQKWDFSKQKKFLALQMRDVVAPKIAQAAEGRKASAPAVKSGYPAIGSAADPQAPIHDDAPSWEEDDVPF